MSSVEYEVVDGFARIVLNNGVTNTLTTDVLRELLAAIGTARGECRGILLAGGERFFSNGVDMDWALGQSVSGMRTLFLSLGECLLNLLECPKPVVAAVQGHAAGAGAAMVLACDYRYAGTGRARIGKPEVLIGVPNPYYGDQLLRFVAGDYVASDLIYSGRMVPVEEAVQLQLLHAVVPGGELEAYAFAKLRALADLHNEAFAESKSMRLGRLCADIRRQMSSRVARQVEIWVSDEAQTRLHAAAERLRKRARST